MTNEEVMNDMKRALTLTGEAQHELVTKLLALGPHARENIGYMTGYFDGDTSLKLRALFDAPHPVFGMGHPKNLEEAFNKGVEWGKANKK